MRDAVIEESNPSTGLPKSWALLRWLLNEPTADEIDARRAWVDAERAFRQSYCVIPPR